MPTTNVLSAQKVEATMIPESSMRILSIQSHVTSGYVGNKAAVFPLQLLGFEVDVLNSCMLSNHTGYKNGAPGIRLTGDDMDALLAGMQKNGLLSQITHVLTGYIGTPSFVNAVVSAVEQLRQQANSCLLYVCDPVLGDNGQLYVPRESVQIYIDKVIRLASILTPNAFELSLLADMHIASEEDAFAACDKLHESHGIPTIFVTGTRFRRPSQTVSVLVSSLSENGCTRFAVDANLIDGHFTGTGDLMSALLLAWTERIPKKPADACIHAMASVTGVLLRTVKGSPLSPLCIARELQLVQSADVILRPPTNLVDVRQVSG